MRRLQRLKLAHVNVHGSNIDSTIILSNLCRLSYCYDLVKLSVIQSMKMSTCEYPQNSMSCKEPCRNLE